MTSGQTLEVLACEGQLSPHFSGDHRGEAAAARPLNPSCPLWTRHLQRIPQHLLTLLPAAAGGCPEAEVSRSRPPDGTLTTCAGPWGGEESQPDLDSAPQRKHVQISSMGCRDAQALRDPSEVRPQPPPAGPGLPVPLSNCRPIASSIS